MTLKPRSRKRADRQPKAGKKKPRSSAGGGGDAFFESDAKRRGGRRGRQDDDIESLESDEEVGEEVEDEDGGEGILEETADEKRVRVAKEHLERIRAIAKRVEEEEGDEEDEEEGREEREGKRDSLVAEILQKEQLEQSGRIRRFIASRVLSPESDDAFRLLVKHRQSVTVVALAEDDSRGFSASKDGVILHWDVESGKSEKYLWPSEGVLVSHYAKPPQNSKNRSKNTLALAVSGDGRYLASGGLDRHVHLWDTRTREHLQAFHGHRGPVSCLTFREGTSQLFSGSFDRTIKLWNVEDRTHMDNLFGHQSEILTIDCLRRERLLTVGRDRTMRLWKVPEESQLVFRAPASALECCCFINDNEFLSGSDDGSIELWSVMRKKPTHLIKNAHAPYFLFNESLYKEDKTTMHNAGNMENGCKKDDTYSAAHSWVSSVSVCRGSDLAASGAANGFVCLWAVENDSGGIRPLYRYPLAGFINSLAFSRSARFLVAGVGQEPRLGGWGRVSSARNGVAIHPITLKEENTTVF